ncbi:SymE family type I addiction module toxin [Pectobacterium aroidearum]|uniref:SymE family type I addiction module toxin n=1 Tax=Pectobacterium aroidearum TaxID=1201031 RepID=UPI0035BE7C12
MLNVSQPFRTTEVKKSRQHYTVGYVPNGGKKPPSPQLKFSGKWLETLGYFGPTPRSSSPLNTANW